MNILGIQTVNPDSQPWWEKADDEPWRPPICRKLSPSSFLLPTGVCRGQGCLEEGEAAELPVTGKDPGPVETVSLEIHPALRVQTKSENGAAASLFLSAPNEFGNGCPG